VLYGFMTTQEREMFKLLISTVSGIGPKIALNVLSGINVTACGAVANADVKALSQISGVGKTAERIVVELKDRIGGAGAWKRAARSGIIAGRSINDAVLALIARIQAIEACDSCGPRSPRLVNADWRIWSASLKKSLKVRKVPSSASQVQSFASAGGSCFAVPRAIVPHRPNGITGSGLRMIYGAGALTATLRAA
jgi:hypothetical protein